MVSFSKNRRAEGVFFWEETVTEQWLDIKGYEGVYQVSDAGLVRRTCSRYDAVGGPRQTNRVLIAKPAGTGYRQVCLSWNGSKHYLGVHRLVAEAFIPNPGG